jgi:hypothetical protein
VSSTIHPALVDPASPFDLPGSVPPMQESRDEEVPCEPGAADSGYFQLTHAIFRDPELRTLSGDTFRLYLWLSCQGWRFRDSDGTLRASVGFITEGCGLPHATVSRGLKTLREKRLVQLVKTDFKRGNIWRVSRRAVWSPRRGKVSQIEAARIEGPPVDLDATSIRGSSRLNSSKKFPQIEAETRNPIPFKKSKNSFSCESSEIRDYFVGVKPISKWESEKRAYQKLRHDYEEDQIAVCLTYLCQHGIPVSGAPCHSPMGFLAKAMGQVWSEVQIEQDKQARATAAARHEQAIAARRAADDAAAEQDAFRRERAFAEAFPSLEAQEETVTCYANRFPMFGRNGPLLRRLAIAAWWQEQPTNSVNPPSCPGVPG